MQTTAYKQQQKTDQLTAQTTYSGSLFWFGKVSFFRSSTASIISSSLFLMRTSLLRVADSAIQPSAKTNLHMLHQVRAVVQGVHGGEIVCIKLGMESDVSSPSTANFRYAFNVYKLFRFSCNNLEPCVEYERMTWRNIRTAQSI